MILDGVDMLLVPSVIACELSVVAGAFLQITWNGAGGSVIFSHVRQ
jgi:hypothetical protein